MLLLDGHHLLLAPEIDAVVAVKNEDVRARAVRACFGSST